MRLTSLRLRRYGPFENLNLTLDPAPARLNLICAPNGAGKSVLRQAFSDLLFGIGGKSPMAFRFRNTASMHLAATALSSDGTTLTLGRRKGHGNTLTDEHGAPLDPVALAAALGGTDQPALERLFALDTERLRLGGTRLMASGGLVADALLSAGGLGNARDIKRQLEQQADALAPARRSEQRPFYMAADGFVAARKAASQALLKPDAQQRLSNDIAKADAELTAARQTAADRHAETRRLQRLRRVRPTLAALDQSQAWLSQHQDAPALAATLRPRLDEAAANLRAAQDKLRAETQRRQTLDTALAAIAENPALLAQAPAIDLLAEHGGAVAKALEDLPARAAELAAIEAQIAHRLRGLGAAESDPAALIPPRAVTSHTRALIRQHGVHEGACRAAGRARDDVARQIAAHQASPAPETASAGPLTALIEDIRAQGDPATQARDAASRLAAARAALDRAVSETPFWTGDEAALRALTLPAMPVLEATHAALTAAEAALTRDQDALGIAETRLGQAITRKHSIVGSAVVPDRDAVAASRRRRMALWDLVARTAFGTKPDPSELAILGGTTLPLAYERAVVEADLLADRRADESSLIERAALAEADRANAQAALAATRARHEASLAQAVRAAGAWQKLLPDALPGACRLDDLRAFAAARLRVIERGEQAALAAQTDSELAARHAAWAQRLLAVLPPPDPPEDDGLAQNLPGLLARARRQADSAAEADQRAAAYHAKLRQLTDQHSIAEAASRDADASRAAWQTGWAEALAALGRPAGESPAVTEEILGVLAELDADLGRAEGLATRVGAMRADNAAFTGRVAAIAAHVLPGQAAPAGPDAALALLRVLRESATLARQRDTQRRTLSDQIEQAGRQIAALAASLAQRQSDLEATLTAIGAATQEEADHRLTQAAARAKAEAARDEATLRLRQDGDGVDPAILRAALASLSAEDIARDLYTAEAEAAAAQQDAETLAGQAAVLKRDLAQREAETSYDDAIHAQNAAAATAGRVLREAAVARLAACLLGNAMEVVEKQATPVMLRAIGGWFTRLTAGAYSDVGVEPTAEGAALILTEAAFPDERRAVEDLSEGTRDQLFLALRLAAIESHPVRLPFIADDILQTADDARAEAALHALMTLSASTQVILLTHHQHIADLATRLFPGAICRGSLTT
jgi:uncharacterized protein YhaN